MLIALRGRIADIWSIGAANLLIAAGYGAMWSGARVFDGRRPNLWIGLGGVAVWLAAALIPGFYADPSARASLSFVVKFSYTLATVMELWRTRGDRLPSRWPAIVLLLGHALALPSRLPQVGNLLGLGGHDSNMLIFITFESVLLAVAGAYLFGSLVRERVAKAFQRAAMADPLTGVANRRAFLHRGARQMQRGASEQHDVCLLLFDIDHFKGINDQHGHAAGDAVLTTFCDVAKAQLRPIDLLARIGGEEFVCLLVDVDAESGVRVAERVLFAFEGCIHNSNGRSFGATASAGVAHAKAQDTDLSSLLLRADEALYRAKHGGRNQVAEKAPETTLDRAKSFYRSG